MEDRSYADKGKLVNLEVHLKPHGKGTDLKIYSQNGCVKNNTFFNTPPCLVKDNTFCVTFNTV